MRRHCSVRGDAPSWLALGVGACVVVALAVSAFAAGAAGATADADDAFSQVVLDPDDDEREDDEESDDSDDSDDERADFQEERDELQEELDEERAEFEEEQRELEAEREELQAEGEWEENREEWESEMEALREEFQEERAEIRAEMEEAREEFQQAVSALQDGDDEQSDDDRAEDADPPRQVDPTPSPTPSEATATATPSPTPASDPDPSGDDGSGGAGPAAVETTSDGTVASHEIGGFEPIRSVSVDRTTVTAGEQVEIVVTVENVNDDPISVPVELAVFGEVVAVENVTVSGDSTERVRFRQRFDAPGTYHPSVGDHEATVQVEPQSTATGTATPPADTTAPTGQVGFGAVAALVGITLLVVAARRR